MPVILLGKLRAVSAELKNQDSTVLSFDRIELNLPSLPPPYSGWGISIKISYEAIAGTSIVSDYNFNSLWAASNESVEKINTEGTSILEKCTFYYGSKWNSSFPEIGTWTPKGITIHEHFRDQSWDVGKFSYYSDKFIPKLKVHPFAKDMLSVMAIDEKGISMVGIFKRLITKSSS